jgi:hypothetical protein
MVCTCVLGLAAAAAGETFTVNIPADWKDAGGEVVGVPGEAPGKALRVKARSRGTGQLSSPTEYVGEYGTGSFTQSGGTNQITTDLYLGRYSGSSGTCSLSGGTLDVRDGTVADTWRHRLQLGAFFCVLLQSEWREASPGLLP